MEEQKPTREIGLIPKLFKKWKWRRKFTKEELAELDKIKKESFMKEMRKKAEEEGKNLVKEEVI